MALLDLSTVQCDIFIPLVGQAFTVNATGSPLKLELMQARPFGRRHAEGVREPFVLDFRGPQGLRLPQGIYRFEHEAVGAMEIFVTQHGDGPRGSEFEAIFN